MRKCHCFREKYFAIPGFLFSMTEVMITSPILRHSKNLLLVVESTQSTRSYYFL
jgi:hypothetical protein